MAADPYGAQAQLDPDDHEPGHGHRPYYTPGPLIFFELVNLSTSTGWNGFTQYPFFESVNFVWVPGEMDSPGMTLGNSPHLLSPSIHQNNGWLGDFIDILGLFIQSGVHSVTNVLFIYRLYIYEMCNKNRPEHCQTHHLGPRWVVFFSLCFFTN